MVEFRDEGKVKRQDKHIAFAESLQGLKRAVDRIEDLLNEINGEGKSSEKNPTAAPFESGSLSSFLSTGSNLVHAEADRLDKIRESLREALF